MGAVPEGVLDEAGQAARAQRDETPDARVLVQPQRQLPEADRFQEVPHHQVPDGIRGRGEGGERRRRPHRRRPRPHRQPVERGAHLPEVRLPHRRVEARTERQLLPEHPLRAQPLQDPAHPGGFPADHRLVRAVVMADHHPRHAVQRRLRPRRPAPERRVDEIGDLE